MWGIMTLADSRPLANAKLVLFIDHDKSKLGKLHILLDYRMGTDHYINFASFNFLEDFRPFFGSDTASQQPTPNSTFFKQCSERTDMLAGKDFSGCHQCRLVSVRNGCENCINRHDRLSATNIPLEQAVHGCFAGNVVCHLLDHFPLSGG